MDKRKKNKKQDVNVLAFNIVHEATGDKSTKPTKDESVNGKNPAAVALGRLGGLKGGPARAKKLSKKKRSEIARKAAKARWGKSK